MEFLTGGFEQVLASVVAAVGYAGMTYLRKWQKGEEFELEKVYKTIASGVALGVLAAVQGFELTGDNFEQYMAANAGAILVADNAIIIAKRFAEKWL